jgi:hypothetical protein
VLLSLAAGYAGHRTVSIGLRRGLVRRLADAPGSTAEELAEASTSTPSTSRSGAGRHRLPGGRHRVRHRRRRRPAGHPLPIDRVTDAVRESLELGGWFVISDFPFPDTDEGLRTVPGRIMSGIQFFEAQIDDQLVPRAAYDELLGRHGFTDLGSATLAPVHALTWGRRPA